MNVEFRRADRQTELRSLLLFDRKVFQADAFDRDIWSDVDPWWMIVDGVKAGCSAFEPNEPAPGTLYIATTGILPRLQGRGLGRLMKAWQIAWARQHGFQRIVTNHRASNKSMIQLNRCFGFRKTGRIPAYYSNPDEAAVSMELVLQPR
jgi:ribosomal protein S18 acetylase RimI-like enzyme